MHIATDTLTVTAHGEFIVLTVQSGPEKIRIAMTPHQALAGGHGLCREGQQIVEASRAEAEVFSFADAKRDRA